MSTVYVVSTKPNPGKKPFDQEEYLLTSGGLTKPVDYWIAQAIERAIHYGKSLAQQEVRQALGL